MDMNGHRLHEVVNNALSAAMNDHLAAPCGCQPLYWSVDTAPRGDGRLHLSAFPGADYTDEEGLRVAAEWAAALGLTRHEEGAPVGLVDYSGLLDKDVAVVVWAITDRELFERRARHG